MLDVGDTLGGYRIDRVLGEGGMGLVFEATQLSLDRKVALKVVASHLSAKPAFRERFRREGLLQAAADHPHILPVYEAGEDRGSLFLAMRLIRGPNLAELIKQEELPLTRALAILSQVADALDSAHEAGMVHRDVKPQNILVDRGDYAFLADFGITRALGDQGLTQMTQTGEFLGSIHYVSPEQIRGDQPSAKSDLYALAAVLYECLVGRPPFTGDIDAAVVYAHISQEPPLVSVARLELPPRLDAVVARGLAKDPDERYPTARELLDEAYAAVAASGASTLTSPTPRPPQPAGVPTAPTQAGADDARRYGIRWALGFGAVIVLALLAVGGYVIGNDGAGESGESAGFVRSGAVGLTLPAGWRNREDPLRIPKLALADAISVGPEGAASSGLKAGRTQATGSTLLPAAFRGSTQLPKKTAVRVGEYEAYRYQGVRGDGIAGELTVYTVPTSRGVVTLACLDGSPAQPVGLEACERVVGTLELSGVRTYPLGPSAKLADSLRSTFATLDAERRALRRILAAAATQEAQADAARELADAYGTAARRLSASDAGPEAQPAAKSIVRALGATERAYRRLARAASAGDEGAYESASASVATTEKSVERAMRALPRLGYSAESE